MLTGYCGTVFRPLCPPAAQFIQRGLSHLPFYRQATCTKPLRASHRRAPASVKPVAFVTLSHFYSAGTQQRLECICYFSANGIPSDACHLIPHYATISATSSSIVLTLPPAYSGKFALTTASASGGHTALPHRATCSFLLYGFPL